jgi:hypothetical protein
LPISLKHSKFNHFEKSTENNDKGCYKENHVKRPKKLIELPIHSKEQIMENQTKNTAFTEEKTDKQQNQTPNPKNLPAEKKWQLVSLLTGILLIAAVTVTSCLYLKMNAAGTLRGRLEIENQSLREQLNLAGTQIAGLKNEMEKLLNRNVSPANENPNLKSQTNAPVAAASLSTAAPRESASGSTSRIEAMRKGIYSNGATKEELIEAIGEPDRVYNVRGYEQLVYFGKKPGRFWLIGGHVVQIGG